MWSFFRHTPLRFAYRCDYAGDKTLRDDDASCRELDPATLPLDPILQPRTFVRPPRTTFAETAWRIISDVQYFNSCILKEHIPTFLSTSSSYGGHISELERWTVLRRVQAQVLLHACKYFAVPKIRGKEISARTIFDGRSLNSCCWKPAPVNIPDPVEVGRYVANMMETHGNNVSMYLADFRHYFHQIPVCYDVARYFGVKCGQVSFIWSSLPMGFSWAPFIAQALGIGLLFEATRDYCVRDYSRDSGIPRYLELRHEKLGATARIYLTYDNVAVISSDKKFTRILQRLIRARLDQSQVVIKEEEMLNDLSILRRTDASGNHLGVQYAESDGAALVRVAPDTIDRWASMIGEFASATALEPVAMSRRQLARVCGVIVHSQRIRQRGIHANSELLAAIRSIYPLPQPGGWETKILCSANVRQQLALALKNEWSPIRGYKQHATQPEAVIASDACGAGVGWIIHTKDGTTTDSFPNMFPKIDNPHQAIFVKEVLAATLALEAANRRGIKSAVLLIDNSAGASAIRNGFSNNEQANALIARITALDIDVRVVAIPGISNPADAPSRGSSTQVGRMKILGDVLEHPDRAPILAKQQAQQPLIEEETICDDIEDALADVFTPPERFKRLRSESSQKATKFNPARFSR